MPAIDQVGVRVAVSLAIVLLCGAAPAQTPTPTPLGDGPRLPFFGPVDPDGCLGCCAWDCAQTPTPTPVFDAQGRRVFVRTQGRFLLVIEAARGPNRQFPGRSLPICLPGFLCDPSDRGDAWVMVDRPLGNGSTAICDTGASGGGVPAAPLPLDFRGDQAVTDVIRDLMCRFSVQSSQFPCTRTPLGNWGFLDENTATQYCFAVPQTVVFPDGDTVLAAQVRDFSGAFGERKEIVIRVQGAASGGIDGVVQYYSSGAPVAGVSVDLAGPAGSTTSTAADGSFSFAGLSSANFDVEPSLTGNTGAAVTPLDAVYVLQAVVGKRTLSPLQELACDVSGDGALSSLDAVHILQLAVGKRSRFDAAIACGSDWAFVPAAAPTANQQTVDPLLQPGQCVRGRISYQPLSGQAAGQDFDALVFGDCSGNW